MSLLMVAKYIKLSFELVKHNLSAVLEYRIAFTMQAFGMVINNICWVLFWGIFFEVYSGPSHWDFQDTILIFSIACFAVGVFDVFFSGAMLLSRNIYSGELDYYLGVPKNPLWLVSMSRMNFSGFGDLVSGIVFFIYFVEFSYSSLILFLFLGIFSALGLLGFVIITQSVSFFIGNFEDGARELFWSIITFGMYPLTSFSGAIKILICSLLPAFIIFGLPVRILQHFNGYDLVTLIAAIGLLLSLGVVLFNVGLRRYESGSLMQIRG